MDIVIKLLLWLHFASLVIGAGAGFSSGQVMMRMPKVAEEGRPGVLMIYSALARLSHIGLGLLILSGIAILFLKYGNPMGMGMIFWVKMALVVALMASVGIGSRASKAAQAGDQAAGATAQKAGMANGMIGFATILAAVFAF